MRQSAGFSIKLLTLTLLLLIAGISCGEKSSLAPNEPASVDPLTITIETVDSVGFGAYEAVAVKINRTAGLPYEMGGFDFLIQCDTAGLTVQGVRQGNLLRDWGWEYFTIRHGGAGDCDGVDCPSGIIRAIALAETNNGAYHPSAFSGEAGDLFLIDFRVTGDTALGCGFLPLKFVWYDCGDNNISSRSGDSTYLSHFVYDETGAMIGHDDAFPTSFGAPDTCSATVPERTPRLVVFRDGGIDLACPPRFDRRGDINLNGYPFEVADVVLYANYFVYGPGVLVDTAASTAASDANADGATWSLPDFVYMENVVLGDALPYPPDSIPTVDVTFNNNNGWLSVGNDVPIGAAFLVASGNVTPTLVADSMEIYYAYNPPNTNILVWPDAGGKSFTGQFLYVDAPIVSIEMATAEGFWVNLVAP